MIKGFFRKYIGNAFIVPNLENEDKLTVFQIHTKLPKYYPEIVTLNILEHILSFSSGIYLYKQSFGIY